MAEELAMRIDGWSRALAATGYQVGDVPAPVRESGGVLVTGASDAQIEAAEERLGTKLPPSYRTFLRTSNGAYASSFLQCEPQNPLAPGEGAVPPFALYPIEHVDWARRSIPFLVDLSLEMHGPLPNGGSTIFDGDIRGSSSAGDLLGTGFDQVRHGHLQYALHIGAGSDSVFLDPLNADAAGEWQVIVVGSAFVTQRHRSFGALLDDQAHAAETELARPAFASGPSVAEVLTGDLAVMSTRLEAVLDDPDVPSWHRTYAFTLLGALDDRDHGDRRARRLHDLLRAPHLDDVPVLEPLVRGEIRGADLPSPGQVFRLHRPADQRALEHMSRSTVGDLLAEIGSEGLEPELERRALPPFDSPAAALLAEWSWQGHSSRTRPVNARPRPEDPPEAEEITAASAQLGFRPEELVRSLHFCGWTEQAIDLVENRWRSSSDDVDLLYVLAEIDEPRVWEILDRALTGELGAGSTPAPTARPTTPEDAEIAQRIGIDANEYVDMLARTASENRMSRQRGIGILAAARTSSPLLPSRALQLVLGDDRLSSLACTALELQQTASAADALLDAWRAGDFAALRALARRRDARITNDCLALLDHDDPDLRLVGARVARDLREPATVPALLASLERSDGVAAGDEEMTVTVAHALAMMQVTEAASSLRRLARSHPNQKVSELFVAWAAELEAEVGG